MSKLHLRQMKNKFFLPAVILTVILAGILRLSFLTVTPPQLNWDEAAWGYNAYSILKTGKDEYGKFLPVFFRSFDEYKSGLPVYLIVPSVAVFGLNEFAVRFPSALLGVMTVLVVILLSLEIFKNQKAAIFGGIVLAIEPWAVHLSRVYPDANTANFFLLSGILLFEYTKKQKKLLSFSLICFFLSMFTYNSYKIIVPLFLAGLFLVNKKFFAKFDKKTKKTALILAGFFLGIFLVLAFFGQAFARVGSTNIFALWPKETEVYQKEHVLPFFADFLIHNRMYYFSWEVGGRFFSYYSPYNLFLREPLEPATVVAGNSLFYPFEFIFWFAGLIFIAKNFKKYPQIILLMLIAPLPPMMTWNWFQPARGMALFTVFSILIGLGISKISDFVLKNINFKINILSKKPNLVWLAAAFLLIFMMFSSTFYLADSLLVYLPFRDSGNWQSGMRETAEEVFKNSQDYDQVIVQSGHAQPYIFYLFYGKYDPAKYQKERSEAGLLDDGKNKDFGKFKFRKIFWPDDKMLKKALLVGDEFSLPKNDVEDQSSAKVIKEVTDKKGIMQAKIVATE